jgi:(p)ppGpp synthase/HD superfamily hydrolase
VTVELAQTNLQLYNYLISMGWSDADLVKVRDAYILSCELFCAMFRPSGKPFLAHLVGTASVLAAVNERPAVVVAGLLHASYTLGEFGDGLRGMTERKREKLRRACGSDVEPLVAAYTRFEWTPESIRRLAQAASMDAAQRDVLVIRLANEVDDWSDVGLRYAPEHTLMERALEPLVDLAGRIGLQELGEELRDQAGLNRSADVPGLLVRSEAGSYTIAPRSYRRRFKVAARQFAGHSGVARARRALRSTTERLRSACRLGS